VAQRRELIDRAKFKEVHQSTKERVARNAMPSQLVVRASVRLVENQHKEGRLGEHVVHCDEAIERGGTNKGPSPLEYLVASVGF
jgi:hypothetical protein